MKTPFSSARGGFTLIEMIITLSIFLLLTGAVFGIFSATLQSASTLQDDQARSDQAEAMAAWLKRTFLNLPPNAEVVSYHRETVPFDVSDLVWSAGGRLQALDLQLQPDGRYTLRLTVSPPVDFSAGNGDVSLQAFARQVLNDDSSLAWRPLLRNVTTADWRFRIPNDPTWRDAAAGNAPLIVQFTFQLAGTDQAVVADCWIPPLLPPTGNQAPPPAIAGANP